MLQHTRLTPLAFALLGLSALAGFWKHYLAQLGTLALPALAHVHALLMAMWCVLLIVQPLLLRLGQRDRHRQLGRSAWLLAPAIVASSLALAVVMTRPAAGAPIEAFRYSLFFLQIATALLFGGCVAMALAQRRDAALHARWMVAGGITFIDPVFARVFSHLAPPGSTVADYGSMLIADAVLLAVIIAERRSLRARWIFPAFALLMLAMQATSLTIGDWGPWRRWMESIFS